MPAGMQAEIATEKVIWMISLIAAIGSLANQRSSTSTIVTAATKSIPQTQAMATTRERSPSTSSSRSKNEWSGSPVSSASACVIRIDPPNARCRPFRSSPRRDKSRRLYLGTSPANLDQNCGSVDALRHSARTRYDQAIALGWARGNGTEFKLYDFRGRKGAPRDCHDPARGDRGLDRPRSGRVGKAYPRARGAGRRASVDDADLLPRGRDPAHDRDQHRGRGHGVEWRGGIRVGATSRRALCRRWLRSHGSQSRDL